MNDPDALQKIIEMLTVLTERVDQIQKQLDDLQRPNLTPKILPLNKAWKELGYSGYRQCWRKIGTLYRPGHEAIDRRDNGGTEPVWYLDIEKCRERDRTMPAKRGIKS